MTEEFPKPNFTPGKSLERNIKEGVDFVFEQNPELAKIGTKEQYSEYLDTIFPKSKIKNIVYHTTSSPNIEEFRQTYFGVYFAFSPTKSIAGDIVYSVIVNAENPLIKPNVDASREEKIKYTEKVRNFYTPISFVNDYIRIHEYDSSIESSSTTKEGIQLKIRNPEQIHILGSKQDIERFKEFVQGNKSNIIVAMNE
ncbi:MAG: hypothetical protein KGZ37_07280 [Nitrosarchaeum sp.]|nr:hypothetical protein [Nitrosarchaeum sp.]